MLGADEGQWQAGGVGEADEHKVQCPPQIPDTEDRIQHATENNQLYSKDGGMQEHPSKSCIVVCES